MGTNARLAMKVFVVGNVAVDETFAVSRVPHEGESIFGTRLSTDLGGKGANQALILARCGIPTIFIAAVGSDAKGDLIHRCLNEEPVAARLVKTCSEASDSSIIIKDERGGNAIITTTDCSRLLNLEEIEKRMKDAIAHDILVLQGNISLATTQRLIAKARSRKMKIILNPSPFEIGIEVHLMNVNTVFLNQHEALQITGHQSSDAVEKLLTLGVETVVLSEGEKGLLLGTHAGIFSVPAHTCDVIDSTGAGDTLLAVALAAAILRQENIALRSLEVASRAAALTVSRSGTRMAFPTVEELERLLS